MSDAEQRAFLHQTSIPLRSVNRLAALYVALLAGFWGGHKFLLGARREGWIYLALCWTSVPLWASLMDFAALLRQPAIGQGVGVRRLLKRHVADADVVQASTWLRLLIGAVLVVAFILVHAFMNEGG